MKVTYLGHATIQLEIEDKIILIDPFITANPAASEIDIMDLKADYIFITHAHTDHILDVEAIAKNTGATIVSSYEIVSVFSEKGMPTHGMSIGGKWNFDFGLVKGVVALHTSGYADNSYGGVAMGFVFKDKTNAIYVAGDTGLTMDMKLIPLTLGKIDLAILPIGDNFTMGYEDAVIASDFVECDTVLGYHYGTFPPITIDTEMAKEYFKSKNKSLLLPKIKESITI